MTNEMFRAVRQYKDMSQSEFAGWIGVSLATIGRIENGSLDVTTRVKGKLAHKFELNDDFFAFYEKYRRLAQ